MQIIYAPNSTDDEIEEQMKSLTDVLLLKNTYKEYNGHFIRGDYSDPLYTARYIDELNQKAGEERYGFCLDVGAANICGLNLYEMVVTMRHRLKALIIRENDGVFDSSYLPFTIAPRWKSLTDWPNLIRAFREINYNGILVMNYKNSTVSFPIQLRPYLDELAKAAGKYFKWQIEMEMVLAKYEKRVLFGAGNMCKNYMKYYSRKYPVMFTCDNNSRLWGTTVGGIEVKSPEEIKNISEDCVVFICNIHYEEIRKQLEDMGIKNRIEYFNDEYLPFPDIDELEEMGNCLK